MKTITDLRDCYGKLFPDFTHVNAMGSCFRILSTSSITNRRRAELSACLLNRSAPVDNAVNWK